MEDKLEEWLKAARSEDMGEVAGRMAEEIDDLRVELEDFKAALHNADEKVLARQREAEVNEGRIRRLRNALMAAGVSEDLVAAIEWDR